MLDEQEKNMREKTTMRVVEFVYSCILEAGDEGIPSGHLYAVLMGDLSLGEFQAAVGILKKHGFITDEHHLLKEVKRDNPKTSPSTAEPANTGHENSGPTNAST